MDPQHPIKLDMMVLSHVVPALRRWKQEDQEVKVILGHRASSLARLDCMRSCLQTNQSIKCTRELSDASLVT